jgi:uncharacterized membrane protein YgcG
MHSLRQSITDHRRPITDHRPWFSGLLLSFVFRLSSFGILVLSIVHRLSSMVQLPRATSNQLPAILLLATLLLAGCGGRAPDPLIIDEGERLERSRILQAAAPLTEHGARVAVFAVEQGDSDGTDANQRLADANMLRDNQIIPEGIAVYISSEPRYSELRVGTSWNSQLSNDVLERIRQETLNPALRDGDYTGAVIMALGQIEAGVAGVEQRASFSRWIGGVIIGGALLVVAFFLFADAIGRSPLGELAAKIWARTPMGKREARRRHEREVAYLRGDLSRIAEKAAQTHQRLPFQILEFQPQLVELERRDAGLKQNPVDDQGILKDLRALRDDYERFAKRVTALKSSHDALLLVAEQAHNQLRRVDTALRSPRPQRRKRRNPQTVSAGGLAQLEALNAQILQLDREQTALNQPQATARALQESFEDLTKHYKALMSESLRLWRTELPGSYNQYLRSLQPRHSSASSWSESSSDSSYSSYSSSSSDTSSSSSYDSSSSSDSSSSGESRAGGDW